MSGCDSHTIFRDEETWDGTNAIGASTIPFYEYIGFVNKYFRANYLLRWNSKVSIYVIVYFSTFICIIVILIMFFNLSDILHIFGEKVKEILQRSIDCGNIDVNGNMKIIYFVINMIIYAQILWHLGLMIYLVVNYSVLLIIFYIYSISHFKLYI